MEDLSYYALRALRYAHLAQAHTRGAHPGVAPHLQAAVVQLEAVKALLAET